MAGYEVFDHYRMHEAHHSGQTLLQDMGLMREVFMFTILAPLVTGLALTALQRVSRQRDQMTQMLLERHKLVTKLNKASYWEELANLVVQAPALFAQATKALLFVRAVESEELNLAASWVDPAENAIAEDTEGWQAQCLSCMIPVSQNEPQMLSCSELSGRSRSQFSARQCLPLRSASGLVGVLSFIQPCDLTVQQEHTLNDLAPELVMAVEKGTLQRLQLSRNEMVSNERQRIARNLHDTLAQNITYLCLKLDQLGHEPNLQDFAIIKQEIESMDNVANQAYGQVRTLLVDLQPSQQMKLPKALLELCENFNKRAGFTVHFMAEGGPLPHSSTQNQQLLYICREALNNVEKHAKASNVNVTLSYKANNLVITITDNGHGFQPDEVQSADHFGLNIMQERAQLLKGEFNVTSELSVGTTVILSVPIST